MNNKENKPDYLIVGGIILTLIIAFLFALNNRYSIEVYECQENPVGSLFDDSQRYQGECIRTFDKWTGQYK